MTNPTYAEFGWNAHFARQSNADDTRPFRVTEVHRDSVSAISPDETILLRHSDSTGTLAVGDWVQAIDGQITTVFDRQSLLKRRAPGTDAREQLIAANVTTLGIVSSCNSDFNLSRIERYLVLAADADCLPLVILTKADRAEDPDDYVKQAERLSPLLSAIAIDATDPLEIKRLHPWCRAGDTLALVGSSGVGKTTIRNALTGEEVATQGNRNDDKGRHTTTSRALVRTTAGGWLIDTPGMRALRLADASDGVATVFADIEDLTLSCRFSDCAHDTEPGCAVQAALASGAIDNARMKRWQKLKAEERRNSETLAQARARNKGFGKMVKGVMAKKRQDRGG